MWVKFRLNGEPVERQAAANYTLLDFLSDGFGMLSVKKGCDEGQCGACTVLVDGKTICACLVLAVQIEGTEITTLEGLAKSGELNAIQQAFAEVWISVRVLHARHDPRDKRASRSQCRSDH